jgi:hypothetical protein
LYSENEKKNLMIQELNHNSQLLKFRKWLLVLVGLLFFHTSIMWANNEAAGAIEGTITDKNSKETLIGANIVIEGTLQGTVTDINGHFVLSNLKPGKYKIKISYVSYNPVVFEDVVVEPVKTTMLNAELEETSLALNAVTVTGVRKTSTELSMISSIKTSTLVSTGISSQQIGKSQDRDASEVVRRVPGITIIDDRFIVVRGLAQRYNNVWLNNAATPSSEADVKSFSFDVIPSATIDNLMVYKSPAPELPADFAGGFIKITTKNMPESNSYSVGYSASYNTGTTFGNFYNAKGGSLDWLGFDDGSRALPSYFPSNLNNVSKSEQVELGKKLNKNWRPVQSTANPDQRFSIGMNHRIRLGKATLGEITSLNYSNSKDLNDMSNLNYGVYKYDVDKASPDFDFRDSIYSNKVKIGGMNNWALLFGNGQKIEIRNIYNHIGNDRMSLRSGREYYSNNAIRSVEQGFLSRSTYSGQVSGTHNFGNETLKIEWILGYAYADRNEPDIKRLKYILNEVPGSSHYNEYGMEFPLSPLTSSAGRLFMKLKENIISSALNIEKKITIGSFVPSMKAGIYTENKSRTFSARKLGYVYSSIYQRNREIEFMPVEEMFSDANMNTTSGITLGEETNLSDSYSAGNKLYAGYLALNLPISKWINVYAGARVENNTQTLDSYDRFQQPIFINNKKLNIFPSVNASVNITSRSLIRVAYGKSINRPEFREIAPFPYYDFDQNAVFSGNPELTDALIDNYDLRYEFYPTQYETVSVGLFYKHFQNPIEIKFINTGSGLEYSYKNAESADNYGIEVDVRKSFQGIAALHNLSFVFNGALIQSRIHFNNGDPERNRPMAGQSPFIINTGLFYNSAGANALVVSVLYNVIGKRLNIVGIPNSLVWEDIPDVYEMPRHVIDFTISQKLGKHIEIKGGIKDILNQNVLYQQNIDYDVDMTNYGDINASVKHFSRKQDIRKFRPGSFYSLGVTFMF